MRGESGIAGENVRRPSADLLQRDTLRVVNMLDLARELSGEPAAPRSVNAHPEPSEFWKRAFADWRGITPVVATVPPSGLAGRKPAQSGLILDENVSDELRAFA